MAAHCTPRTEGEAELHASRVPHHDQQTQPCGVTLTQASARSLASATRGGVGGFQKVKKSSACTRGPHALRMHHSATVRRSRSRLPWCMVVCANISRRIVNNDWHGINESMKHFKHLGTRGQVLAGFRKNAVYTPSTSIRS